MFNNSKYTKWYFDIIKKAQSQNRKRLRKDNPLYIYYERHHIIPNSLGGSDDKTNLVLLTSREHFVCHVLLPKMCENSSDRYKMDWALTAMSMKHSRLGTYFNSRLFEYHKNRLDVVRSEMMKTLWENDEFRHSHKKSMQSVYGNPEIRNKISSSLVDHYSDENNRKRQSQKTKEKFEDENYRNNHLEGIRKSFEDGKRSETMRESAIKIWSDPERRKRQSERYLGKPNVSSMKKCTDGVDVFDSLTDLANKYGIHPDNMSRRIKSDKERWKDFQWIK